MESAATTPARMFGLYGKQGRDRARARTRTSCVYDPDGHTSIGVGKTHHMNMDYSAWEG